MALGDISVIASGILGAEPVVVTSDAVAPVWNGTTDLGDIVLEPPVVKVGYFYTGARSGSDYQRQMIEQAGFEAVNITDIANQNLSELDIVMIAAYSPDYWDHQVNYRNSRERIADYVSSGGALIYLDEYPQDGLSIEDIPGNPVSNVMFTTGNSGGSKVLDLWSEVGNGPFGKINNSVLSWSGDSLWLLQIHKFVRWRYSDYVSSFSISGSAEIAFTILTATAMSTIQ